MSFIEEITSLFGYAHENFRYVVLDGRGIYLEGVKSIFSLSDTAITFEMKKGKITVSGENLFVKKYGEGDACVCGKISKVTNE